MLKIPDWLVGLVAGIFLTCYVFGVAFRYLPSPLELLGDIGAECHQTALREQQKAESDQNEPKNSTAIGEIIKSKPQEREAGYEKNVNECLVAKYTGSLATLTLWLVIATFLLAAFGFWQVIISRHTARRQLRAYVFIEKAKIGRRDEMPGHIEIIVLTKNSGQTPAYDVTIWADSMFTTNPRDAKLVGTKDPEVSKTNLPPGGKYPTSFYKKDFSPAQSQALYSSRDVAVFIWGEVRYIDAFKTKRRTKFRFIMRGGPEFRDKPLAFAEEGNEST